jgi:hypothetical protein
MEDNDKHNCPLCSDFKLKQLTVSTYIVSLKSSYQPIKFGDIQIMRCDKCETYMINCEAMKKTLKEEDESQESLENIKGLEKMLEVFIDDDLSICPLCHNEGLCQITAATFVISFKNTFKPVLQQGIPIYFCKDCVEYMLVSEALSKLVNNLDFIKQPEN